MDANERHAPGWPGGTASWTSSAKSAVGTALSADSHVWFTLSHGIVNEVYYPRLDRACVRDLGLVITDGAGFFSEEKHDTVTRVSWLAPGVPAFKVVNSCRRGRYTVEKEILADPRRDAFLQLTRFVPSPDQKGKLRLFVLLAPHLCNQGAGNTAWVGECKGVPMLFAEREGHTLALACSLPWLGRSVGFVGASDGWQDLAAHGRMTRRYTKAENGNVALTGEVDLSRGEEFLLAVGFGAGAPEAGFRALAALQDGFAAARTEYLRQWQRWQEGLAAPPAGTRPELYESGKCIIRSHEDVFFPGGIIASLAIPWGFGKGDNDLGGYHLVWARDLVEAAGGFLSVAAHAEVRRVLWFLQATQEADGHWPQNMWVDGSAFANETQLDETALPILLVNLARREKVLTEGEVMRLWPMVRQAAGYLARNGPVSPEDRWEEDPGYSPFTVAAQIAALLAAADFAEGAGEHALAGYLVETADAWYDSIDRWMYVTGTDWCRDFAVNGYYLRIAPPRDTAPGSPRIVILANAPPDKQQLPADHLVSPDALSLVRFGLRRGDDPRIRDTVQVIDALLKLETEHGPIWYRYNNDGYGETEDGGPFRETGVGRPWPLLIGERAHYELAAGRPEEAKRLLQAMESFASPEGLIPEQVWDGEDIPERELFFGHPSGSAMPLIWAHAEYLKLVRSLERGRVFDLPPQTVRRYLEEGVESSLQVWRFNHKLRHLPPGKVLRIETLAAAVVRWSADRWRTVRETETTDTTVGVHFADLPLSELPAGTEIVFTFRWLAASRWEGTDFLVGIFAKELKQGGAL